MQLPTFSIALAITTCLAAQDPPTTARPPIRLDTVGPDGWRVRIGPTNLGSMLESARGRELWGPRLQPLFAVWQRLAGSEGAFAACRTRMLGYGGRIRAGLWFDANGRRGMHATSIAVVLHGDGRSDLQALAGDLRQTLYQAIPGRWDDEEVDGATIAVRHSFGFALTAPSVANDTLVIAVCRDVPIATAVQQAHAFAAEPVPERAPDAPVARLDVDLARLVGAVVAGPDLAWTKALGVGSLGTTTFSLLTAGPHLQLECAQQFVADERGLFGALMPANPNVPSLLAAIPTTGNWIVGHFDLAQLHRTSLAAAVAAGRTEAEAHADAKAEHGVDLATELLPHATDEVLLWLPEPGRLLEDFFTEPVLVALRLRDEAAFGKVLFPLLPRHVWLGKRTSSEAHGDVEIHHHGDNVLFAVGRGVAVIATGRDADDHIRTLLDRCRDLPATLPPERALPADFAHLRGFLPPGCHGFSACDPALVLGLPEDVTTVASLFMTVPDVADLLLALDLDGDDRAAMAEILREHRLDVVRSASGYADRTWRWRAFW
jgi:hypothetical protein